MYNNNEFRPTKRAHSPEFENNFRGGFRGHAGHQFNKRHRGEFQPMTLDDKIARLGDTGSRNIDIGILAKEIDAELSSKSGDEEVIKSITSRICTCIVSFPTRVSTYATLIGLVSVKHYNVSCQIINTLHASYPIYLEAQKWDDALTIMHLMSCLVNCKVLSPPTIISQFEQLLEVTAEDNIPQARSDYYVYTVLSSLPYVAQELSTQADQQPFELILTNIEAYLNKRSKEHLTSTRVWLSGDSTVQMDYLDSLWVQTKNFRANSWIETFLHRPNNDKEYKDLMASSLIPQNSPTIQIPAHSPNYIYPCPRIVFRIFEDDVSEGHKSIPGSDKIERFCIENHIRSIINELPNDPRDCSRHLSHMYRSDQLPMKHILVETLLGELFTLPRPRHHELLYHSILYELTKIFHSSKNTEEIKFNYDTILNEGVKILYENLDSMNITCFTRFVEWFSFHLNNTLFLFPWQSWSDATLKQKDSPKAIFVKEILDHCVRFSFHKKINLLVSANLGNLMPPEVGVKYNPVYSDNPKAEELADKIKKLIVEKADGKTISESLNIMIEGVELPEGFELKEEKHFDQLLKIDIFTAVILSIASKSLTHLSSAIGKFKNVFKALTRLEQGQVQLLQTMHSCLETHPQLQVILVDKLLKADLIEAKEVCHWLFSDSMKPNHLRCYPWELLNNTIRQASMNVNRLIKEKAKTEEVKESADGDVLMKQEKDDSDIDEKIEKAQRDFKDLMFLIFRLFSELVADHIGKCEASNSSYMNDWFRWITGRMQQVYFNHYAFLIGLFDEFKNIIDKTPSMGCAVVNLNK